MVRDLANREDCQAQECSCSLNIASKTCRGGLTLRPSAQAITRSFRNPDFSLTCFPQLD